MCMPFRRFGFVVMFHKDLKEMNLRFCQHVENSEKSGKYCKKHVDGTQKRRYNGNMVEKIQCMMQAPAS